MNYIKAITRKLSLSLDKYSSNNFSNSETPNIKTISPSNIPRTPPRKKSIQEKESIRKLSTRNRMSFVLTLFAIYYTLSTANFTIEDLIVTNQRNIIRDFLYASAISILISILSIIKNISRYYLIIHSFILFRFLCYVTNILIKYYKYSVNA